MKRRQFAAGLATMAGGSLILGSGAFSFTRAERKVNVNVVRDAEAYLALRSEASIASGDLTGEVRFEITPATLPDHSGKGVGPDSIYRFTDDGDGVFSAQNQGVEDVVIYGEPIADDNEVDVYIVAAEEPDTPRLTSKSPSPVLNPGDQIHLGIVIDTYGVSEGSLSKTVDTGVQIVSERLDQ